MFTGIVEEVGTISQMKQQSDTTVMTINCQKILSDMHIGDSISVNGVCLTVTSFNAQSFSVDIVRGTSAITLFHTMKVGTEVNLERALLPTTRLGGHFVSGHIDTSVSVKRIQQNEKTYIIELVCPEQFRRNVIPKGSIAVNGISLTIFELTNTITLNIIPETVRSTMLKTLKTGDKVHIEFDMLGKYILNQTKSSETLTLSKLEMMM
ncbi:riboflavin synthase [Macrococcoides canis]|uniref:riboflavin synthase n=1 Tax=Macrococcoides canis TaxID=1855823 RepID=UPI001061C70D|nr:riboflavin synthase [Macrococcus canis]TDM23868.1 riboflavin synthase [Macrococcus canis]TDM29848.1 riboflavin synthase [Macrococcus canis]TDM35121.1 riboflavin synthase [Macrococcus canis]